MPKTERTCVVSRKTYPRHELIRLVAAPSGQVIIDYRGKLPGRGAWIHPSALAGLDKKSKMLAKQLGADVDASRLRQELEAHIERALRDGLSMAAAGGAIVGGHDRLIEALQRGELEVVAFATDGSARTRRSVEGWIDDVTTVQLAWTSDVLGRVVGRGPLVAVGVRDAHASAHALRQLRRLADLG